MDDMNDAGTRDSGHPQGDTASWRIVEHVPLPGENAASRLPPSDPGAGTPTRDQTTPPADAANPDAPVYWEYDRPRTPSAPHATSWAAAMPSAANLTTHQDETAVPGTLPLDVGDQEHDSTAGPSWRAYAPSHVAPLDGTARERVSSHPYEMPMRAPPRGRFDGARLPPLGAARGALGGQATRPAAHDVVQALDRFLLAAVVLAVALCAVSIMAAEASAQANHAILSVAHVDIRASLSHLMAWLRGLRP
ncbi:MAG TPA: hypothetical protein VIC85_00770 [Ktedonobacterales bacterium]|jgi:hypothetical protein